MTLLQFDAQAKPGRKFIIQVDGGYFAGWTMRQVYLISDIAGALVINSMTAAVLWKTDIGKDARIQPIEYKNGKTFIQQGNKKLIF